MKLTIDSVYSILVIVRLGVISLTSIEASNSLTVNIIKFIISKSIVHYQDIMDYTGLSRRTISKYLDKISDMMKAYDVELVRKRNVGIYFDGNLEKLISKFQISPSSDDTSELRQLNILNYLMTCRESVLIDDIADKFYISRSTLTRDLKKIKTEYKVETAFGKDGIFLKHSEEDTRKIISRVISKFWIPEITHDSGTDGFNRNFNIPSTLEKYIDEEILSKTLDVLQEFERQNKIFIKEYEYQSLLIHITIAIQRIKDGDYLQHEDLIAEDYAILDNTNRLVKMLEATFDCCIPLSEIRYLNIHVLAITNGHLHLEKYSNFEEELVSFLKENIMDYDTVLLKNLLVHLQPAIKRNKLGVSVINPYCEIIKSKFPLAMDKAVQLAQCLSSKYQITLNEDEICYIALHFEAFLERSQNIKGEINVALVCSTGFGTAALLKQQIKKKFGNMIKSIQSLSVQEVVNRGVNADVIISTVPFDMPGKKILQVTPFISEQDFECLEDIIKEACKEKYATNMFLKMIDKKCIIVENQKVDYQKAIEEIVSGLHTQEYVTKEMLNSAIKREKISSTALGSIAIPHGDIKHVIKPVIGLLVSKQGIIWGNNQKVNVVFFIALNKEVENKIDEIYSHFYELIQNEAEIKKLSLLTTADEVYQRLLEFGRR